MSNQSGIGSGPITGGLFLGSDAAGGLTDTSQLCRLPGPAQYRARRASSFQAEAAFGWRMSSQYGSGLPAESKTLQDSSFLLAQYGPQFSIALILTAARTRPTFSLDVAAGAQLYRKELRSVSACRSRFRTSPIASMCSISPACFLERP